MKLIKSNLYNVDRIKKNFPILRHEVRPGIKLIYLDSAATSQKPASVIKAMDDYYYNTNANIHRGIHSLAEKATVEYESARKRVAAFISAKNHREIVFTRNATEAINLVAHSWARTNIHVGGVILLTEMEHHSNLVPWQILAEEKGIKLKYIPVREDGLLNLEAYYHLLELQPQLVSFAHMSNVLGTINPARQMIQDAHRVGAITLLDGAQSVPHFPVSVQDLGVDFLAFSGHKMCAPTGIGCLFGREALLESMPPFLGGGDMIKKVYLDSFTTNDLPHKFEAGTPPIAQAIALGAAVDYLTDIGMENIAAHEREITSYALKRLSEITGLRIFGPDAKHKGGVISFSLDGVHPHDVAQILNEDGIAVRAGHHCAMPLHQRFNLSASTRASFYLYNDIEEVDRLVDALEKVKRIFN